MKKKIRSVKKLFSVTSFLEGLTGLALMSVPSLIVQLLLGSPLVDRISVIIARVAGTALISLAAACWLLRKNENVNGLVIALLFYNFASAVLLGYAGLLEGMAGIALWLAVAVHIVMFVWCVNCIAGTKSNC